MGRETKILLTLLGLLAGVFVGVVSLKLFVPRPPAGTGPDIHAALAVNDPVPLVEPPALGSPTGPRSDDYASRTSRFGGSPPPAAAPRELLVTPVSFEPAAEIGPDAAAAAEPAAAFAEPAADLLPPPALPPPRFATPPPEPPADAASPVPDPAFTTPTFQPAPLPQRSAPPAFAGPRPQPGGGYLTSAGDSWWSLAEQAYGDGRLYRALFAWNRSLDPRVSLVPGTRLEIPPAAQLGAAWPALLPTD